MNEHICAGEDKKKTKGMIDQITFIVPDFCK